MAQRFNPEHKTYLDDMLLGWPGVEPGQMFGHPSYKTHGKIFASLMEDGVTIKLPESIIDTVLQQENISPFRPMPDRIMRQWVLIQVDNADQYADYGLYFEQALAFVAAEATAKAETS